MPKKQSSSGRRAAPSRSAPKKGAAATRVPSSEIKAAEEKFTRDVLIRGEASQTDSSGNLPLDATHEIVKTKEGGLPKIQRRRFKLF